MNGKENNPIHWFPGHMQKALREMKEVLPLCDVVLYVLDARAVKSCMNPSFDQLILGKPVLYILNKKDLVPQDRLTAWIKELSKDGKIAAALNSNTSSSAKEITPLVEKLTKEKIEKYKNKGIRAVIRGIVIGVPNSGKSTLINNFCAKAKAKAANKPGVTRGQQWLKVSDNFELLDTPGTLYPKLEDQQIARRLAFIGSIKSEVIDEVELAKAFIDELKFSYPKAIPTRYKISDDEGTHTLEAIAKSRGFMLRKGELDIERAAVALLDDFRKGRLGKIILDSACKY